MKTLTKQEYLKLQEKLASARQYNLSKKQKLLSLKKKSVPKPKPWYVKLADFLTL